MNRRYFENLMAERGISLRSLAKEMGINHSQLSLTLSGARRLQLTEAVQLADLFGVPLNVIAANAGAGTHFTNGTYISVVGAMRGNGVVERLPEGVVERVMIPPNFVGKDATAIQARTADTPLSWMDGIVCVCRPALTIESEGIGRLCWLALADGREVIATPRRGYSPNTMNLTGPFQAENVAVKWARPVVMSIHPAM